jgi:hypothetical protein
MTAKKYLRKRSGTKKRVKGGGPNDNNDYRQDNNKNKSPKKNGLSDGEREELRKLHEKQNKNDGTFTEADKNRLKKLQEMKKNGNGENKDTTNTKTKDKNEDKDKKETYDAYVSEVTLHNKDHDDVKIKKGIIIKLFQDINVIMNDNGIYIYDDKQNFKDMFKGYFARGAITQSKDDEYNFAGIKSEKTHYRFTNGFGTWLHDKVSPNPKIWIPQIDPTTGKNPETELRNAVKLKLGYTTKVDNKFIFDDNTVEMQNEYKKIDDMVDSQFSKNLNITDLLTSNDFQDYTNDEFVLDQQYLKSSMRNATLNNMKIKYVIEHYDNIYNSIEQLLSNVGQFTNSYDKITKMIEDKTNDPDFSSTISLQQQVMRLRKIKDFAINQLKNMDRKTSEALIQVDANELAKINGKITTTNEALTKAIAEAESKKSFSSKIKSAVNNTGKTLSSGIFNGLTSFGKIN